ncbi:MAG: putative Ig domain-containing protein, partial [Acidobacteriota bacterium]
AAPGSFQVTHITSASSTAEMTGTDIALVLEQQDNVASTAISVNAPPTLTAPIPDQNGVEGVAFILDFSASFIDPEDQPLTFSAAGLPSSLRLEAGGILLGTPSTSDVAGSPYTVDITATDPNGASTSGGFTLSLSSSGDAIFVDGFESGDTGAWSAVAF